MVKAHGGGKMTSIEGGGSLVLGGILTKTTKNMQEDAHMKGLDRLIQNTTGVPRGEATMEGVLASTVPMHMKAVPELQPVHQKNKTVSKMSVGMPYSGPKSGYGMAKKH